MSLEPHQLIHRIQTLLRNPAAFKNGETLAREFANRWDTACQRLEDCDRLREYGDEYTAVQIAETPPPVLEELDTLTFPELDEWKLKCDEKGWPYPLYEYDQVAIENLQNLYAKPLNANHELYRELQGAILRKEFPRALPVLRELHSNFPDDESMLQQRKIFEAKTLEIYQAEIEENLRKEENDQAIDRWLEIQEEEWVAPFSGEVYDRIAQMSEERAQERREEAGQALYYQLSQLFAAKEWESAYQCFSDLQEGLAAGTHFLGPKRAAHLEKMGETIRRHQRIRELMEQAENQIEGIALLPDSQYKTLAGRKEVRDFCVALEEMENEMASLEGYLSGRLEKRKKEVLEQVETLSQRYEFRLRLIQYSAGAAAVLILVFILFNFFALQRERGTLHAFDERIAEADALQLQSFMENSIPNRIRFYEEAFEERKARAEEIMRPQLAAWERVQENRQQIETIPPEEFASNFSVISHRLAIIEDSLNDLPSSERQAQERFLRGMNDQLQLERERRSAAINREARDLLRKIRQLPLNPNRIDNAEELEAGVTEFSAINEEWQILTEELPRFIQIEESIQSDFTLHRDTWQSAQSAFLEYQNYQQALHRPGSTRNFEQIISALARLDLALPSVAQSNEVRLTWNTHPDPFDSLFPDFRSASAELRNRPDRWLNPSPLEREERRAYQTMLEDYENANLDNLRMHRGFSLDARGNTTSFPVFVIGDVSVRNFAVGREIEEFTFEQFHGTSESETVTMRRSRPVRTDGQSVSWEGEWLSRESRSIPELQVMRNLQGIFDSRGNSLDRPLLGELERIYQNEELDPRFKLFIDYHFYQIFRNRPQEWGIAFSNDYQNHRRNFERVLGGTVPTVYDFLSPESPSTEIRALYQNPPEVMSEASAIFSLNRQLANVSTELVGFIDSNNGIVFHRDRPETVLFVLSQANLNWEILNPSIPGSTASLPLSPIMTSNRPLDRVIADAARESGLTVEFVRQQWQHRAPLPE